ncbi:MAG TPA: hypothetical protein VGS58_05565 [Candidatus Sulfopaludibacter sp.]|nr:hypothetical protein [Candidatus Sulfopaludibacter sp.]
MRLAKRMFIGGVMLALAVSLVNLVSPRSMRAAVATLVQVTNSTANPVAMLNISASATQNVTLLCNGGISCVALGPGGATVQNPPAYVVPTGQNLVITDIEITPPGNEFKSSFAIDPIFPTTNFCAPPGLPSCHAEQWTYYDDGLTKEFQFPSGIVYPENVKLFPNALEGTTACLRGYLTTN